MKRTYILTWSTGYGTPIPHCTDDVLRIPPDFFDPNNRVTFSNWTGAGKFRSPMAQDADDHIQRSDHPPTLHNGKVFKRDDWDFYVENYGALPRLPSRYLKEAHPFIPWRPENHPPPYRRTES